MEVAMPTSFNTKVRREVVLGRIIEIYRKIGLVTTVRKCRDLSLRRIDYVVFLPGNFGFINKAPTKH